MPGRFLFYSYELRKGRGDLTLARDSEGIERGSDAGDRVVASRDDIERSVFTSPVRGEGISWRQE
jgi:hypothetical protein